MLWKTVSQSKKVNKLSLPAAFFWTWCIPWFDRDGYLEADTDFLKFNVIPKRRELDEDSIALLIDEIIGAGLWEPFIDPEGNLVVKEKSFNKHQRLEYKKEKESKWEGIKLESASGRRVVGDNSPQKTIENSTKSYPQPYDSATCQNHSGLRLSIDNSTSPRDKDKIKRSLREEKERESKERECEGKPEPLKSVDNFLKPSPAPKPKDALLNPKTEDQKKELQDLALKVNTIFPNFRLNLFLQNHNRDHPEARLHSFQSLITAHEKGIEIKDPMAYCEAVIKIENQNYNARDFYAGEEKGKVDFSSIAEGLKQLNKKTEKEF
jgi:hypothetical protein